MCVDVYHVTFAPPGSSEVADRLKEGENSVDVQAKLSYYHE